MHKARALVLLGLALVPAGCGGAGYEVGTGPEGQPAIESQLAEPEALVFDGGGNLYVSDCAASRVFRLDQSGAVTLVAGRGARHVGLIGGGGFSGDGGPATKAELNCPAGLALDDEGNLYIADHVNDRVRRVDTEGVITTFVGSGAAGPGAGGFSGDGAPATRARLDKPAGIAFADDSLYIADQHNNRIRRVSADGVITTVVGTGDGRFSGDGGPATNAGLSVQYVIVDSEGNLYVSDHANERVRKIDSDGVITTVAGPGEGGLSGDGGPATKATLSGPYGLALDKEGNLYVSELRNARVRRIDTDGVITTVAGTGQSGFSGDGGPATKAKLSGFLLGLAVDEAGNLYVADGGNGRIRKVDAKGVITTVVRGGR